MKQAKKLLALLLVAVLVISLGSLTAFADGTDGKVTVENATVGVTYKAYKVFDATYEGENVAYTVSAALYTALGGTTEDNLSAGPFTISKIADAAGNHNVQLTSAATDAATVAEWIKNNLDKFTEVPATSGLDADKKATGNTVEWGNLAYGYYYVTSGLGSVVTIDSAIKEVTVKDKNPSTPTPPSKVITAEDAVIDDSDQTELSVEANDAAVGSKESFKVTYTATNYVTNGTGNDVTSKKVLKFYIEDQPRNMTIDPATVAVNVGNISVISGGAVVDATGHPATVNVAEGDEGELSITIDWVDANGNSIYAAADGEANIAVTLTYDATILAKAATENADNTVTVKYDRDGEPKQKLGDDKTDTYTYKFKLEKIDATTKKELAGAKFNLKLGSTVVTLVKTGDGAYRVAAAGDTTTTDVIEVPESGEVIISGLDKKAYSLTEIEAPKGYNLLTEDTLVPEDTLVKANAEIPDATKISVENNKGTELPSTGGIGTTIFYVVGGLLLVGAGVLLVTKKRVGSDG